MKQKWQYPEKMADIVSISHKNVSRLGFPRCPHCNIEPMVLIDQGIWFAECADVFMAARNYNDLKSKWNAWVKKYPLECMAGD